MNFDQMMDAWKAQDDKPLYGVNRDLLKLVLQHEQDRIRRTLRRDQWITYVTGIGIAVFAGFWLWLLVHTRGLTLQTVVAAICTATFALWLGAFWVSRRRQARRERGFGNTLREEIGRNLSLVEYQISNGRWGAAILWSAPVMVGVLLIYWVTVEINDNADFWLGMQLVILTVVSIVLAAYTGNREVKRKLEPRRQRLRELLEALNAGE